MAVPSQSLHILHLRSGLTFVPFSLTESRSISSWRFRPVSAKLVSDLSSKNQDQLATAVPDIQRELNQHWRYRKPARCQYKTFPAHPIKSSQERRIHTAIPTDRSEVAIESKRIESSPKFAGIQAAVRAVLYRVPAGTICARQRSATFYLLLLI